MRVLPVLCRRAALAALLLAPVISSAAESPYERGLQAASDFRYSEAMMHFKRAAEQGDAEAMRNLGLMFLYGGLLYGAEVPKNVTEAKRWLAAARNQGCKISEFMLNVMAQHGR